MCLLVLACAGMWKCTSPLSHARLLVIDSLQFVDHLITPSIRSSKFGCDSLRMIGIEPRDPVPKPYGLGIGIRRLMMDAPFIVWVWLAPLLRLVGTSGIARGVLGCSCWSSGFGTPGCGQPTYGPLGSRSCC